MVRGWAIQCRGQASGMTTFNPGWTGALAADAAGPDAQPPSMAPTPALPRLSNGAVLVRRAATPAGDIIFLFLFLGVRGGYGWSCCRLWGLDSL